MLIKHRKTRANKCVASMKIKERKTYDFYQEIEKESTWWLQSHNSTLIYIPKNSPLACSEVQICWVATFHKGEQHPSQKVASNQHQALPNCHSLISFQHIPLESFSV